MKILGRFVPTQIEMSTFMGGVKTLLQETAFYITIINLIMITRLFYYSASDPWIRTFFPHYLLFMLALVALAVLCMTFEYTIMYPSKMKFGQEQAVKADRSPLMREVLEIRRQLNRIEERIEKKE
ncbi:MAG: hypothetical protein QMC85_07045 [Methanocellales archaeon]|nr:hypothetical protein [Methanocellales archaeon]